MSVATALVSGNEPLSLLAEQATARALAKAGLTHASGVLLFLTPEFSRHAQHAVTACARQAQCTTVAGAIAVGVLTEDGWVLDRPAAAAMVFGGSLSVAHALSESDSRQPLLSLAGSVPPPDWFGTVPRFGGFAGNFSGSAAGNEALVWQQGRVLAEGNACSVQLLGGKVSVAVSSGLQLLGEAHTVERCNGYDLERIGGRTALACLTRCLPADFRQDPAKHLHHLAAIVIDDRDDSGGLAPNKSSLADALCRPLAIIALNADRSLTLTERINPGQTIAWAVRRPLAAEADMQHALDRLTALADASGTSPQPACGLMFSCIGRGPFFYGGEDSDLAALRQRFPGLPLIGTYGTGQIGPMGHDGQFVNRPLQNAVVTALVCS